MADEQLIKPRELPAAVDVFSDDAIMTDDGVTVSKATPVQIVNAGAPVPTQAEAIAGVDNTKRMTPLTTKQVLDNVSAPSVLRAQAWAESATAPDPSMPGSKSSRTWALEAAQSASDAEEAADTAATNTANAITSAMQGYVSAASGSASAAATSETNAATSAGQAAISAGQAVTAMAGSVRFDQAQTTTPTQKTQARDNIGLGSAATRNTGTSGATIPLLDSANTWSAAQTVHIPTSAAIVTPEAFVARSDYSPGSGSRWGGMFQSLINAGGGVGVDVRFSAEDLIGENSRATIRGSAFGGTTKYWNFRLDTGNAHCVSGSWINSSDPDLKEFDGPWPDPVAMLFELNGREYTRKDTGARGVGLSAADVERILPSQIYHNGPAHDPDGNLLTENARAIDTAGVGVAVLVEALKVAFQRIEALEDAISDMSK